jgi:hypothetical protein
MKQLILSLAAMASLVSCTNTKKATEIPSSNEANIEENQNTPNLETAQDITDLPQWVDSSLFVTPFVNLDSLFTIVPGDIWEPWPPYNPWPITIDPGIFWVTSCCYFVGFDTLVENRDIPKDYFTSGKNCYSILPNENGASFEMEVVEEEIVEVSITQFGDCKSHLPLNISWLNTPLVMKQGQGSIQLNYPKHYELDLQINFKGTLGQQSIQIQS